MKHYLFILSLFFCSVTFAQSTISGRVADANGQGVPGTNIKIVGDSAGTVSDIDGKFTLKTTKSVPFTIELSNVGYDSQKVSVTSNGQKVNVKLNSQDQQLDEIVVAASRTPERIKESPVTIERMTLKDIRKTAAPSFYDGIENLKEVQMNTSSLSFKSVNTRGFASVANERFMQLVDGMDNSSPLLNFVLGNLIGLSEVDVKSVELLPGASSALYGANAFNGILFMTSQSPFDKQGISAYAKFGQTSQKAAGSNDFYDYGVRIAKAFNPYFAAKANFTYMRGTDWWATNYDDKTVAGIDRSNINYNGINVYGDEVSTNIKAVGRALAKNLLIPQAAVNLLPDTNVSRTGYNEIDLTDSKAMNTKLDFSLHARPFGNENFEIILQSKFGFGNAVYQGANRYYLNNFFMQQHKLEFKGKNFFVRGYTTTEDGGRSYDMLFTGINVNRKWKPDATWFGQYAGAYIQRTLAGDLPATAHAIARRSADTGRLVPGTDAFKKAFNEVVSDPDVLTGSKLVDNSRIYHSDVNYNFKDIIKPLEIQVGGSYRVFELNSFGRIYTDKNSKINYNEYGIYTQLQKKLMDDKLKLTGSIRYDKAQNFAGNYSPRISAVYSAGDKKNHTFRTSFQTGFRNPSTQDQYIGFNVGSAILLGSAPDNLTRYTETLPISIDGQIFLTNLGTPATQITVNGNNAYYNSYTATSAQAFQAAATANPSPAGVAAAALLLRKSNAALVKPETVKAMELGYRGSISGFSIDLNGYYNTYNSFIGRLLVVAPSYGTAQDAPNLLLGAGNTGVQGVQSLINGDTRSYQLYTNTDVEINSYGFGAGVTKKVYGDFELSGNYNYSAFTFDESKDPNFKPGFNTPRHRAKATLSNDKLFGKLGAAISGRWNTCYQWQSSFVDGTIAEATVLDVQANYTFSKLKSTIKLGATNIGGKEYGQVLGAGLIGQQYFVSWTINP
jgi:outer membrane receptor protein involved in Fe transport